MSAELEIPDAVYNVMLSIQDEWHDDEELAAAIRYVAGPVVAAELDRLADEIGPQAGVADGSDAITRRACAADLRARATELRGEA